MFELTVDSDARVHGTFELAPGMHAVVGASGAGKTSLFRLIAGLDRSPSLMARWRGQSLSTLPSHARSTAFVPQRPSLVPHRTIARQVKWVAVDQAGSWNEWIDILDLGRYWLRYPADSKKKLSPRRSTGVQLAAPVHIRCFQRHWGLWFSI